MHRKFGTAVQQAQLTLTLMGMIATQVVHEEHDSYLQFIFSTLLFALLSLTLILF